MYISIIFGPLLGSILSGFLGFKMGSRGSSVLSIGCMFLAVLGSGLVFYEVGLSGSSYSIELGKWLDCGVIIINWGLLIDPLTACMLIVINVISLCVHIYSVSYMGDDPYLVRFMSYLSMFTFFMLCLVTADNYIQLFIGWEGVGLASYCLINFWYMRMAATKAALKAVIVNRIGDFGLLMGIVLIFDTFKSVTFKNVFTLAQYYSERTFFLGNIELNSFLMISIFLIIGAVGKSAQLGLHTWLPDAMEGPTPVSALIHAATMVTAGVYVLIRSSAILEYNSMALNLIMFLGALTAVAAGLIGLLQNDLKRVIAYSTCSQLGYMVFACGNGQYAVSMAHLMTHAFFKALLFLSAGCVIHAIANEQDLRKMGGLGKYLPVTTTMMLLGVLALNGFPYFSGYYTKDLLLELAGSQVGFLTSWGIYLGSFGSFLTGIYSMRMFLLTFEGETNNYKKIISNSHEAPILMILPLVLLVIGSLFLGFFIKELLLGGGTLFWQNTLGRFHGILYGEVEFQDAIAKYIPVYLSLLGMSLGFLIQTYGIGLNLYFKNTGINFIYVMLNKVAIFLVKKWYFDYVYKIAVIQLLKYSYNITLQLLDRGVIELAGPSGLVRVFKIYMNKIISIQSGLLYHYTLFILGGLILLLSCKITVANEILIIYVLILGLLGYQK